MSSKTKTNGAYSSFAIKNKRNITTKQVKGMLTKNCLTVSEEDAAKILDFLYFLGELTVQQYFKDVNGGK